MNITKEEIKSAGLQHVEEVKGGNACYDSFVAGVEYMLQKLKQCNVSGALPPDQIIWPDIEKTKQLYRSEYNPDCTGRDEDVIEWTLNNVVFKAEMTV